MPANTVTFIGTLTTDVALAEEDQTARFRMVLQSRRVDRSTDSWVTDRTFVSVVCRRRLAGQVIGRLRRGDPILVTGSLRSSQPKRRAPRMEVEAHAVGLDLARMPADQPVRSG